MDNWMILLVFYGGGLLAIPWLYFKQGRYLTEGQPVACLLFGFVALLMVIFLPKSMFTSRDIANGTSRSQD